ncbi:MAG: universal stress protein [Nitrospiraceae bacterium]|nr:universal stress protein [Nitrospiraceae bacterium]
MNINKILVPTDFSDSALHALIYASDLAQKYDSELFIINVIYDLETASGLYVPHMSLNEIFKEMEASASKELKRFGSTYYSSLKKVHYAVLRGAPYEEILKFADSNAIDIIVMGTHGRKGIDRLFFGSTVDRVMRNSIHPVLAVPSQHGFKKEVHK